MLKCIFNCNLFSQVIFRLIIIFSAIFCFATLIVLFQNRKEAFNTFSFPKLFSSAKIDWPPPLHCIIFIKQLHYSRNYLPRKLFLQITCGFLDQDWKSSVPCCHCYLSSSFIWDPSMPAPSIARAPHMLLSRSASYQVWGSTTLSILSPLSPLTRARS